MCTCQTFTLDAFVCYTILLAQGHTVSTCMSTCMSTCVSTVTPSSLQLYNCTTADLSDSTEPTECRCDNDSDTDN